MNSRPFLILLLAMLAIPFIAAESLTLDDWPDKVPGEQGDIGPALRSQRFSALSASLPAISVRPRRKGVERL